MNTRSKQPLEMPPFPLLNWTDYAWEFIEFFPSWQNFQANRQPSTGQIKINIFVDGLGDRHPPLPEQAIAYQFLKENEQAVTNALLQGVFDRRLAIREVYFCNEPELNPPIDRIDDIRKIIAPHRIYFNSESKDGCAYLGFAFDSVWDIEHGFGVIMHKTQFIGWAEAEAAFNLDLAIENESSWANHFTQLD
ncbi:hypothetical protein H6F67_03990 [Microcoleus sp. FACHB-1515]|uniref:DUF6985 domain-containing protein n=1 Tax=Cyanophyceae TaxID=3028117 RepID=UPI0016850CB2|nr:hypothetical protein [Microcoleus sp. FACHB-1515]MBD2089014.1 hypothetical protein [Microcoleus sp. FACHB-1515]